MVDKWTSPRRTYKDMSEELPTFFVVFVFVCV